jgi:hypothetical protein
MSKLINVKKGIQIKPMIWIFAGAPSVGKSTLASQFPSPLMVDLEFGSHHLNIDRLTIEDLPTYASILSLMDDLKKDNHSYKTLIIDTATKLEMMIHQHLCGSKWDSIEEYGGGFGKGVYATRVEMSNFMSKAKELANKMDVIITAHSAIKGFSDPLTGSTYDRWVLQLNEKVAQIMMNEADNVFFLRHNIAVSKDAKTQKSIANLAGERIISTEWSTGFDAKCRIPNFPPTVTLSYESIKQAMSDARASTPEEVINRIQQIISKSDEAVKKLAAAKIPEIKNDLQALLKLKGKIETMVANV